MSLDLLFHKNSVVPRFTAVICAACIVIWAGINLRSDDMSWSRLQLWGFYPDRAIWEGKPWALVTSAFVHIAFWHLTFNLFLIWGLGNVLEDIMGPWRWAAFVLSAALVSSATELMLFGQMGIGISGVGYAMFGFAWIARKRIPVVDLVMDQRTINTFLLWLVGCFVFTQLGWIRIANGAHFGGMVFGMAVAALFVTKWNRVVSGAATAALLGLGILPLFWCPRSPDWTAIQAQTALKRNDFRTAVYWINRSLAVGQDDEAWAYGNLAYAYSQLNDREHLREVLPKLEAAKNNTPSTPGDSASDGESN